MKPLRNLDPFYKAEERMKYVFKITTFVVIFISVLLIVSACGRETIYIVEKSPESVTKTYSDSEGYSDYSGYPLTSSEREYIYGVDDLIGETLNLPANQMIAVGYGICFSLRDGELAEDVYLELLEVVDDTKSGIDFVTAIMASAVYSLCPDQSHKIERLAA